MLIYNTKMKLLMTKQYTMMVIEYYNTMKVSSWNWIIIRILRCSVMMML